MKKVLVTLANDNYVPYVGHLENCAKLVGGWDGDFECITPGSDFYEELPSSPSIHFYKMLLFSEHFKQWDWIFYCDLDVLFFNKINLFSASHRSEDIIYAPDSNIYLKNKFGTFPPEIEELSERNTFDTSFLLFNSKLITKGYGDELRDMFIRYQDSTHPFYKEQSIFNTTFIDKWKPLGHQFLHSPPILQDLDFDPTTLSNGYYDDTDYSEKTAVHFTSFFPPWESSNLAYFDRWKDFEPDDAEEVKHGQYVEFDEGGHILAISCYTHGHFDCALDVTDGEHSYNHGNDHLWQTYTIFNGKPDGKWLKFHPEGQKIFEQEYEDGLAIGHWQEWHENGQQWKDESYESGLKNGTARHWRTDGAIVFDGKYKNDKKDGDWVYYYHVLDKKKSMGRYVMGKKEGQWFNFFENEFGESTVNIIDSDGKKVEVSNLSSQVNYKNGVLDGTYIEWDESGKEIINGDYLDGKPVGKWTWYYTNVPKEVNRVKCKTIDYKDGLMHGKYLEWHRDGMQWKNFEYKNGRLEGEYIKNRKDGSKYYVGNYKNGKRFGDWVYFYHNDAKKREETYGKEEKLEGIVREYHFGGDGIIWDEIVNPRISSETKYQEGFRDGIHKEWKSDSTVLQKGKYSLDMKEGKWEYYHESEDGKTSKLRFRVNYQKDVKVGECVEYYKNGELKEKKQYNTFGKLHGDYEEHFVSGIIRAKGFMKNNEMDGKWTFYYHNEQKEMELELKNGSPTGKAKIWFDNGSLKKEITI
jgi:antitoxin component YwqK of YwqJK toxin-antitoxin module